MLSNISYVLYGLSACWKNAENFLYSISNKNRQTHTQIYI